MLVQFVLRSFLLLGWAGFGIVAGEIVPSLNLGFTFDYDIEGVNPRVPTTAQCETIHLKWNRGPGLTGPSPIAPYFMQIYTSKFTTPFTIQAGDGSATTFDYQMPFAPGTRYQICMYDSKGTSGGCQESYTMIPNITARAPSCSNVTSPPQLGVDASFLSGGGFSLFGFPDQCTDISVKPLNGTPPFILTISPPLHPPFNITSHTMDPIVWTVSLGGELPFWMSLVSSEGYGWSAGPLHAGLNGPTDCLAPGTMSKSKAHSIAAGAGVGGLFGGLFLAGITYLAWTYVQKRKSTRDFADPFKDPEDNSAQIVKPFRIEIGAPMIMPVGASTNRSLTTTTRSSNLAGSGSAPLTFTSVVSPNSTSYLSTIEEELRPRILANCSSRSQSEDLPPTYTEDVPPPLPEKARRQ
ncbi:hypothetical protein D9758_008781 [Tetrapyrgos nigripes]|uniref:Uncharacterized protein n=1 Tax=Tetrapyrgos nigripes TaxID=182062 RepID=A0A8H5FX87_9AGAR|nr:hypothetical protein D9758_008781 [Tetrapyrgos nigripes]